MRLLCRIDHQPEIFMMISGDPKKPFVQGRIRTPLLRRLYSWLNTSLICVHLEGNTIATYMVTLSSVLAVSENDQVPGSVGAFTLIAL